MKDRSLVQTATCRGGSLLCGWDTFITAVPEALCVAMQDQRHSKLLAKADALAAAAAAAVDTLVTAARGPAGPPGTECGPPPPVAAPVRQVALPESILANREPYLQGDWRKEPYIPRWGLSSLSCHEASWQDGLLPWQVEQKRMLRLHAGRTCA